MEMKLKPVKKLMALALVFMLLISSTMGTARSYGTTDLGVRTEKLVVYTDEIQEAIIKKEGGNFTSNYYYSKAPPVTTYYDNSGDIIAIQEEESDIAARTFSLDRDLINFIDQFLLRERILVLNLASLRAAKLRRQGPADVPQDIPRTVAVAKAAFEMDDPLQATLYIDRDRWGVLDTMVGMEDIFGLNNIFIHFLKLQLLERKQKFDPEIGSEIYQERYDTILDEYNSRDKEDNK